MDSEEPRAAGVSKSEESENDRPISRDGDALAEMGGAV